MTLDQQIPNEMALDDDATFGDVPPGKNAMAIMGQAGDTKTMWDPNNADEVEANRALFDRLVGTKKFSAFRVSSEDHNKTGERMKTFDPKAGRIIFVPQFQGG